MAVIVKTHNLAFLKKVGVDQELIDQLNALGIKLSLGFKVFYFTHAPGKKLSSGVLAASANDLVKMVANPTETALSQDSLAKAAHVAVATVTVVPLASPIKAVDDSESKKPVTHGTSALPPDVVAAATSALSPVPLHEASTMYQRVRGTSQSSVYVVVAMVKGLKIAARSKSPTALSIRAEGADLQKFAKALEAQGLSWGQSSNYMSGHYTCATVSVDRVLGAVLMGTGIEFNTPFPSMKIVRELSS